MQNTTVYKILKRKSLLLPKSWASLRAIGRRYRHFEVTKFNLSHKEF